ncbi:MAG: tetratricopeptide repeat protein [Nocardioides sp.]
MATFDNPPEEQSTSRDRARPGSTWPDSTGPDPAGQDPTGPEALIQRGQTLIDLHRGKEALVFLRRAVATYPDSADLWATLGGAALSVGEHDQALDAAAEAGRLCPDHSYPWILRSFALRKLGRWDAAGDAAQEAIRLDPDDWQAHVELGRAQRATGGPALASALRAVELAPAEPETHYLLGAVYGDASENDKSRESFHRVLQLNPEHALATQAIAVLDLRLARTEDAIRGFAAAGALRPTDDMNTEWHLEHTVWNAIGNVMVLVPVCTMLYCLLGVLWWNQTWPVALGLGGCGATFVALIMTVGPVRALAPSLRQFLARLLTRRPWLGRTVALLVVAGALQPVALASHATSAGAVLTAVSWLAFAGAALTRGKGVRHPPRA